MEGSPFCTRRLRPTLTRWPVASKIAAPIGIPPSASPVRASASATVSIAEKSGFSVIGILESSRESSVLIKHFIGLLLPGAKGLKRFFVHHLHHGNLALRMRLRDFAIDERVIKPDPGGVRRCIAKKKPGRPRPVNCAKTHGTGFAGRINLAARQLEHFEFSASLANSIHLGMRGRIVQLRHAIHTLGDDVAFLYDNCTERPAASRADVFNRELDSARHKGVVHRQASICHILFPGKLTRARFRKDIEALELLIYIFEIAQITPRDAWSHEFASLSLTPDGHTGRNPSPCHPRGRGKDSGGRSCRSSSVPSPDSRFR